MIPHSFAMMLQGYQHYPSSFESKTVVQNSETNVCLKIFISETDQSFNQPKNIPSSQPNFEYLFLAERRICSALKSGVKHFPASQSSIITGSVHILLKPFSRLYCQSRNEETILWRAPVHYSALYFCRNFQARILPNYKIKIK